jgi:NAD(P)-dependent dehydrogenase (short-subunit alcohol dehydrogenase family)
MLPYIAVIVSLATATTRNLSPPADSHRPGPRTVLVTGGSKGIGRAVAQRFAANGDRVIVHYRADEAAAQETLESLAEIVGGHCVLCEDLSVPGAADRLVEAAGRIDVLVCNHGIYEETPFDESNAADWSDSFGRVLRTNLAAPAELAFSVARQMVARQMVGAIVFVSSRGAKRGEPLAPAYGASKAGLDSLTGSLAQALAPHGIRVSAVAPGFISTAMAAAVLAGPRGDGIRAQSPWGRVGEPPEVAEAIFFLASEGATWCTGAVLDCNGCSYLH